MFRDRPAWRAASGVLLGLPLLLLGALAPSSARAIDPVTIPQGPLPVGEVKPVELSFLTIDGTISPSGDGIALQVRGRARLKNPDKKASFDRQVSFPGLSVADVKVGTQNSGLQPAAGSGPWTLSLRPQGDGIIDGRQSVTAKGPLVDLRFDWNAEQAWGQPLGAARLTLHFPSDLDSEQLLVVDPAPTDRTAVDLTWSYEKLKPAGQVRVFFIAPAYWRPVQAARKVASSPQADAAAYLGLAQALAPVAQAEGMPQAVADTLQAERLAALRRAVAAGPQEARTHQALAAYLVERGQGNAALLAEAVREFKAAYDLAPGDAMLKQQLLAAVEKSIAASRQVGDTAGALAALDVAQAIDAPQGADRAGAYADLAISLLQAGRGSEAEAAIVAGFGRAALDPYAFYRPTFATVTGDVETRLGERVLRFTLTPAPGMEKAAAQSVASLAQSMSQVGGCQVQQTNNDGRCQLEVSIPFADPQTLQDVGRALAARLPADADPALLLVAQASGPAEVDFRNSREGWIDRLTYAEAVDLAPAQAALAQRLDKMKWARSEAEAKTDDPVEAARRRWVLALLDRYQAGWQTLADSSEVTYRLLPPEDIVAPQWTLAWGEQRALAWKANIPRPARLWPYAAGLAAGALAVLGGVLVWRRKS